MFQIIYQISAILIPVRWIYLCALEYNLFQTGAGVLRDPVADRFDPIWPLCRAVAGNQMEKRSAKTVYICAGIGLTTELFWSRIAHYAKNPYVIFYHCPVHEYFDRVKGSQCNIAIWLQYNMVWHHVSVDD